MDDELKRFIQNNREKFDSEEPDSRVWKNIERGLDSEKSKSISPSYAWLWKAATLVLLFTLGFLLFERRQIPVEENSQGFEAFEQLYLQEIEIRRVRLEKLSDDSEILFNLDLELEALEKEYLQLKKEFLEGGQSEQIKSALIWNLQARKELLSYQEDLLLSIIQNNPNASIDL